MRGDKIILSDESHAGALRIMDLITAMGQPFPLSIGIAGESGSGKSSTAHSLARLAGDAGFQSVILAQDDYFHLPPAANHARREEALTHVGPAEVDLELLAEHVQLLKAGREVELRVVWWHENSVGWETLAARQWDLVIVEGTYVCLLGSLDVRAFIPRTYRETRPDRIARSREAVTPFIEQVLEIEHQIISQHRALADVVI